MAHSPQLWQMLHNCNKRLKATTILDLNAADPSRCRRMAARVGALSVDFCRHAVDDEARSALLQLAQDCGVKGSIQAMFDGERINGSENRPVLHTALRDVVGSAAVAAEASAEAAAGRRRMGDLVSRLHGGQWTGATGKPINCLVNIGIGGSDLGPRLVVDALRPYRRADFRVEFLANIDGSELDALVQGLDPERTVFCITSKSFSTIESLTNARTARRWLSEQLGTEDVDQHFLAVTANQQRAEAFGIDPDNQLPMWDWVGGRFSLWSCVGLPIAVACGMHVFEELLQGGAEMDRHFRDRPLAENLPVMLALLGIWYRNIAGISSRAVIAYDGRLERLPDWLQQLDMESNGKGVDVNGRALPQHPAPVTWGGIGTNAQHAFFQWLHQCSDQVPVDFIGVRKPHHDFDQHHQHLLANLVAQTTALMTGRSESVTRELLLAQGASQENLDQIAPQRSFPGNRPSTVMLLDSLCPRALGNLLALYEHMTAVQGWIWGINSFDQWGVELGKTMADRFTELLQAEQLPDDLDPATRATLERLRA